VGRRVGLRELGLVRNLPLRLSFLLLLIQKYTFLQSCQQ
jgi:hypothetical protein